MIELDLQLACEFEDLPSLEQFELWAQKALDRFKPEAELTIRISDIQESRQLNFEYRAKDKPTNVLSFPFEAPAGLDLPLIGDLVICPEIVKQEAIEQAKSFHHHFAHMVIHGSLHLIGFDHIEAADALEMETLEKQILAELGIDDPYRDDV